MARLVAVFLAALVFLAFAAPAVLSSDSTTAAPTFATRIGSRSGNGTATFWMNNPGLVPRIISLLTPLVRVFGKQILNRYSDRLNFANAIQNTNLDAFSSLAREGSTSFINAYAYSEFPLTVSDVISLFNGGLGTINTAAQQAALFNSAVSARHHTAASYFDRLHERKISRVCSKHSIL